MSIKIGNPLHPFSHLPGECFFIPFSAYSVEIYPAFFRIWPNGEDIHLPIKGPVKDFTAMINLKRGMIKVFGEAENGYFQYTIYSQDKEVLFSLEKGNFEEWPSSFKKKNLLPPRLAENLSLGINKSPDWELVKRRSLLEEILPFWFLAGQTTLESPIAEGDSLLEDLKKSIEQKQIAKIKDYFMATFKAGFKGIFCPQAKDLLYQGYSKNPLPNGATPHLLLQEGYRLIRRLLLESEGHGSSIVPLALSLFPAGRALDLKTEWGLIDIEWTKHFLRRCTLKCGRSIDWNFTFPKSHRKCRIEQNGAKRWIDLSNKLTLPLEEGSSYSFDRFEA